MFKSNLISTIFILMSFICNAQYYYKDVLCNKQLIDEMTQLKEQKIHTINLTSFEDDGTVSDGFFCQKKINKNYNTVETTSKSYVTGASFFISIFNENGLLIKTIDSSDISSTTSVYLYNAQNNITDIKSTVRSSDDDFKNEINEEHIYIYNDLGISTKLIKLKNNKDTTLFLFSVDDKKNITIEKNTTTGETYYYYYDTKNRITDVVKLNQFNQKLLPDYMFEYNNANQISQMTSTEEGGSYYFIWKYTYDNGLRIKEKCYSKEHRLMGSILYEYK